MLERCVERYVERYVGLNLGLRGKGPDMAWPPQARSPAPPAAAAGSYEEEDDKERQHADDLDQLMARRRSFTVCYKQQSQMRGQETAQTESGR